MYSVADKNNNHSNNKNNNHNNNNLQHIRCSPHIHCEIRVGNSQCLSRVSPSSFFVFPILLFFLLLRYLSHRRALRVAAAVLRKRKGYAARLAYSREVFDTRYHFRMKARERRPV